MAKNLTKEQQQILVLAVMLIGGGGYGYWNYLLKPTNEKIATLQAEKKDLVAKIEKSRRQARRLPALQAQVEKLRTELAGLEKQLPTEKDIPSIIRTFTREAIAEDLEFQSLGPPKKSIKKTYFEIVPFKIRFSGELHALARFLSSIGQQDRIFKTLGLKLTTGGSRAGTSSIELLNIDMVIETYTYTG